MTQSTKKILDITWPITHNMTEYKDRKTIIIKNIKNFPHDNVRESLVQFHSHTGTHIDSPAHFKQDGKTIETVALEKLVNASAIVLDCTSFQDCISAADLKSFESEFTEGLVVLLKTKNSRASCDAPFDPHFVYLTEDAAAYLASKKISAVGIDYLGIERNQPGHPTHKILLQNDIIIIEGLRFEHAQKGKYFFTCLPLLIPGLEAAPARAILTLV